MAQQTSTPAPSQSNPIVTVMLLLVVLAIAGGISYLGYKIFKGEISMPGISPPATAIPGSGAPSADESNGASTSIPATQGATQSPSATSSSTEATVSGKKWFPLKRVYGTELHTANPFVKDLQQFLNKFKGMHLDIDGAFGGDTESAVMKAFDGAKEISMSDYNVAIAPHIGKPQVV